MPDDPISPFNSGVPLEKVLELRGQGMPNNQIIQMLQTDGFSSDQIFDAMNQADMQANVGQGVVEPQNAPGPLANPMQMQPQGFQGGPPEPQPPAGFDPGSQMGGSNREVIEETTEAIISEKWKELATHVHKVEEWKDKMEHRMVHLESSFKALQDNFDKLHQALIGKIGEYDQNILNVGTEIKAMEKVFQKILPTFTENVNELSRITGGMKKE